MGHMNLCYFRDEDSDKIRNLFEENDRQSHMGHGGFMVLEPMINRHLGDVESPRVKRQKRLIEDFHISGRLMSSYPHNTSQKGTLIITTDYVIDLCLQGIPDDCESFEDALNHLAQTYRKTIMRHRHHLGRDHAYVTRKKLLSEKPELARTLDNGQKEVVPGSNLGHLVGVNFDNFHEYFGEPGASATKAVSSAYQEVTENRSHSEGLKPVIGMERGPLSPYHCMNHWASLYEDDVLILNYDHLWPTKAFMGSRQKRTPAHTLRMELAMLPDDTISESIFLKEYTLMKEFFASQGLEIQL